MQFNFSNMLENIFVAASLLLLLGFIASLIVKKIHFPRVTGYILAGIIFGPYILKIFSKGIILQLDFIPELSLGIIALIIGAGLSLDLLKRLKFRLVILLLFETFGAFILTIMLLYFTKMPWGAILPLAAIATATAPAATVAVMRECRARGPLTETTLALVALDDVVAIILFGLVLTFDLKHFETFGTQAMSSLLISFVQISAAFFLGFVLALGTHLLVRLTKESTDNLIIVLGMAFFGIGIANILGISSLLTNIFFGMCFINISSKNGEFIVSLEKFTPPIYCFFFVLAGANLDLSVFAYAGMAILSWSIISTLARIWGKMAGVYLGGVVSKAPDVLRKYIGLTLAPQAGVAIGLALLLTSSPSYAEFKTIVLNVTLMGVAFNELFGPLLTKYALIKAKEVNAE